MIGVVENMTSEVFGSGGGRSLADAIGAPLLGSRAARSGAAGGGRPRRAARLERSRRPRGRAIVEIAEAVLAIEPERTARIVKALPSSSADRAARGRAPPRARLLGRGRRVLADHFLDAEARGKRGHGIARVEWLATLPDLDPSARPRRLFADPGYERWDGSGALGYLTLAAICDAQLADPPARARVVVAADCFPTGMLGYWVRRLAEGGFVRRADGDVAPAARAPGRLGAARRHDAARDRDPELGRRAARRRRLDGRRHARRRDRRARVSRRTSSRSAANRRTRRSLSRRASSCSSRPSPRGRSEPC